MKRFVLIFSLLAVFASFFVSCASPVSDLAVQTIKWQTTSDGKYSQFYTNDSSYHDYAFYRWDDAATYGPSTTFDAYVMKVSGYAGQGYGVVFFFSDKDNCYRILVNTYGRYYINKTEAGTSTVIKTWTSSSYLKSGYNVENRITIKQNSAGDGMEVYFNNSLETTFSYSGTGGMCGFFMSVGSSTNESFPNTPEDVRFRSVAPTVYPSL